MGDCPPPERLVQDAATPSLSNYISQFTILARQVLSAGYLNPSQIDCFTDQLHSLKATLPDTVRFDDTWLSQEKATPAWPLDVQAATLHAKIHNYVVLLNRQRVDERSGFATAAGYDSSGSSPEEVPFQESIGRQRVLESCREILKAFEFFQTRLRVGLVCWTLSQQSFNAAMLLVLSMYETKDTTDLDVVQRAYSTFVEMNRLGIHRLAEAAVERLGGVIKAFPSGQAAKEKVMDHQGMILLEDPGLQGFIESSFSPLSFKMAGDALQDDRPRKRRTAVSTKERDPPDIKPAVLPRSSKSTSQRKIQTVRGVKPRPNPTTKPPHRSSRPSVRRRSSAAQSPILTHTQTHIQIPPDVTQWPLDPTPLSAHSMSQQPSITSPSVLSPSQQNFPHFNEYNLQNQILSQAPGFSNPNHSNTAVPQSRPGYHPLHHTGSDSSTQTVTFNSQLTPTDLSPADIVHHGFQSSSQLDFSGYGQYQQPPMHHHTPMHTPPFTTSFASQEIPCSYPGQF